MKVNEGVSLALNQAQKQTPHALKQQLFIRWNLNFQRLFWFLYLFWNFFSFEKWGSYSPLPRFRHSAPLISASARNLLLACPAVCKYPYAHNLENYVIYRLLYQTLFHVMVSSNLVVTLLHCYMYASLIKNICQHPMITCVQSRLGSHQCRQ